MLFDPAKWKGMVQVSFYILEIKELIESLEEGKES